MNCPKCNKYILDNLTTCPHCGETLRINIMIDDDYVFNEVTPEGPEPKSISRIILIVIVVLILGIGGVAVWVLTHQNTSSTPVYSPTEATQAVTDAATQAATQAATEKPTEAPTTVPATTKAPQTTAAPSPEQRLEEYARTSGMLDLLRQAEDEHATLSLRGENNTLRARYRVDLDFDAAENTEYFENLMNTCNDLCSQMDRTIYDMNQQSDINNAVLEVYVFDNAGKQVFARTVD